MSNMTTENFQNPTLDVPLLRRILEGVAVATKSPIEAVQQVDEWLAKAGSRTPNLENTVQESTIDLHFWKSALSCEHFSSHDLFTGLILLTLSVATLRQLSRSQTKVENVALRGLWDDISQALNIPDLQETWIPSRSAQGFLAVPLCSIVKDGRIDELMRLHVWLPDGKRGNPDFSVHSHQPFAQSWILAGEGTDRQYSSECVENIADATHAEFGLSWKAEKSQGKTYVTHQQSSTVQSTGKLVKVQKIKSTSHQKYDTYTVSAGALHSSEVQPYTLHATFFYFDSSRGFCPDAPVLGPVRAAPFTQTRDPAGETPKSLAHYVNIILKWEELMETSRQYLGNSEKKHALEAFNGALNLCTSLKHSLNMREYRAIVVKNLEGLD